MTSVKEKPKLFYFLLFLIVIRPALDIFSPKKFQLHPDFPLVNVDMVIGLLVFLIGLIFLLRHFKKIKQAPLFYLMAIFLLLALASVFYSVNTFLSFKEFLRLSTFFLLYFLAYQLVQSPRDWFLILKAVLVSYLIPGAVALIQYLFGLGLPDEFGGFQRIYGTFAHPNPFSFYTFFIIALLFALILLNPSAREEVWGQKTKRFSLFLLWLSLALTVFLLFATYTRSALACFFLFLLFLGFLKYRQILLGAALLFLFVYLVSPVFQERLWELFALDPYGSVVWRFRMWQDMLPLFFWRPWFGYGLGTFSHLAEFYRGFRWGSLEAHNDYLKLVIENGLSGLIAYLLLIGFLLRNLLKSLLKTVKEKRILPLTLMAIVLAFLGTSFFDNILRGTALEWSFWILVAGWLKSYQLDRE